MKPWRLLVAIASIQVSSSLPISFLIHGACAAPLFWFAIRYGRENLLSPFLIIGGAIILAPPIARLLSDPSGSLFYPGERFERPLPMYSIPQAKRKSGLYEEAMAGFQKIADEYPDALQPFVEMIDIAVTNLHDLARAERIYQDGIQRLKKQEDRESLARMYAGIRTRLDKPPSATAVPPTIRPRSPGPH